MEIKGGGFNLYRKIYDNIEVVTEYRIECAFCGEETQYDWGTEVRSVRSFTMALIRLGWQYVDIEHYGMEGIACPDCVESNVPEGGDGD